MLVIYLIFLSFFSLCFRPVPLHSPQGYALPRAISFLGTFLCVLLHREPLPLLAPCLLWIQWHPDLVYPTSPSCVFTTRATSGLAIFMASPTFGRTSSRTHRVGKWTFWKLYGKGFASNISSGLSGEISKEKLTILTSLHLLSLTTLLLARGFPSSSVTR